jgi:hypothetical protein
MVNKNKQLFFNKLHFFVKSDNKITVLKLNFCHTWVKLCNSIEFNNIIMKLYITLKLKLEYKYYKYKFNENILEN